MGAVVARSRTPSKPSRKAGPLLGGRREWVGLPDLDASVRMPAKRSSEKLRVVYLAHPVGAETVEGVAANLARARRWYRWACDHFDDCAFIANWIIDVEVYPGADAGPERVTNMQRIRGLRRDDAVIDACDEVWLVGGEISSGMARAKRRAQHVRDLTHIGAEPRGDHRAADL